MIFFKIPDAVAREQETGNTAKTLVSPNKTYVLSNKNEVSVGTSATDIYTFPTVTIQQNKDVYISLEVPAKGDDTSWGGLYINVSVKANDTWYNLGNPGHTNEIMCNGSAASCRTAQTMLIDSSVIGVAPDKDYTLQFYVSGCTFNGTAWVNKGCDVNAADKGTKGDKLESLTLQNYMSLIIQEVG